MPASASALTCSNTGAAAPGLMAPQVQGELSIPSKTLTAPHCLCLHLRPTLEPGTGVRTRPLPRALMGRGPAQMDSKVGAGSPKQRVRRCAQSRAVGAAPADADVLQSPPVWPPSFCMPLPPTANSETRSHIGQKHAGPSVAQPKRRPPVAVKCGCSSHG